MMPSPRPRSTREAQARLELVLGAVAQPRLLTIAWRWRYEMLFSTALAAIWLALGIAAGTAATAGMLAGACVMAALPSGRRWLVAAFWHIVTPHRLRVGFVQAWIHSRDGKIPVVLLTKCMPFGERVYLWCRAGISADDLWSAREALAVACWATEVRVFRHTQYAHLVVLDVIRRRERSPYYLSGPSERADGAEVSQALFPPNDWPMGDR